MFMTLSCMQPMPLSQAVYAVPQQSPSFLQKTKRWRQPKTGNWFIENPQRGRSNNSALLVRDETSKETFNKLMSCVKEYGEPGFVWAESTEMGFNPCVEIGLLYPVDVETGKSGLAVLQLSRN